MESRIEKITSNKDALMEGLIHKIRSETYGEGDFYRCPGYGLGIDFDSYENAVLYTDLWLDMTEFEGNNFQHFVSAAGDRWKHDAKTWKAIIATMAALVKGGAFCPVVKPGDTIYEPYYSDDTKKYEIGEMTVVECSQCGVYVEDDMRYSVDDFFKEWFPIKERAEDWISSRKFLDDTERAEEKETK